MAETMETESPTINHGLNQTPESPAPFGSGPEAADHVLETTQKQGVNEALQSLAQMNDTREKKPNSAYEIMQELMEEMERLKQENERLKKAA